MIVLLAPMARVRSVRAFLPAGSACVRALAGNPHRPKAELVLVPLMLDHSRDEAVFKVGLVDARGAFVRELPPFFSAVEAGEILRKGIYVRILVISGYRVFDEGREIARSEGFVLDYFHLCTRLVQRHLAGVAGVGWTDYGGFANPAIGFVSL